MYRIVLVLILFFFCHINSNAKKKTRYDTKEIAPELLDNAWAVVRTYKEKFTIHSIKSATLQIKYAITILDKNGDRYAVFNKSYDKLRKIGDITAKAYDKNGALIEKVKKTDIKDYSAVSGYSLFEDNRIKYYKPVVKTYPYTIEYEYEYEYTGLFHFPAWLPVFGYDLSVEHSSFKIFLPEGESFRYDEKNLKESVKVNRNDNTVTYYWEVSNIPAIEREVYSPYLFEFAPVVYTAPNSFEIEGYKGNMESWEEFGLWVNQLNSGRDILPGKTKIVLDLLVEGLTDQLEITRIIYDYLQSRTRYVSIQEGIGGWQPFPAELVDRTGYGDCKALTNYTYALLKYVGVKSYYTKVRAGKNEPDFRKDFVSNQSNHVFLCVPLDIDTVWLECTSQTRPFGYIGNFTDDRDVMIITENGGKIVHSKVYPQEENTQVCIAQVALKEENICTAKVSTTFSGLQYDNVSGMLDESYEDQEKWLYKNIDLTNFNINEFHFHHKKTDGPVARVQYIIDINNYASCTGKRIFLPLNLL
ncbi:MAG: DUF3857 domain-containing protein, partial [Bacteroidota bacterium]|nr:DUF3857 domain-containing protein [Bacteroidota bacterium]